MPSNLISRTSCSIYPINHPTLPAGLPAQEYKHHAFKSSTTGAIQEIVTIESNQDTAFEIKLEINPTAYSLLHRSPDNPNQLPPPKEDDYLIYVHLDGIQIQRSKRHRSQNGPTTISGVYSADLKSSRSFQFGKIHLVDPDDDNRICEDEKIIQALGTIQVNIVRCFLGPPQPAPNSRTRPTPINRSRGSSHARPRRADPESLQTTNQMIFSERSKKACQLNTVGLSKPIPAPSGGHVSFHGKKTIRPVTREDPHPFLQFIFKYKPRTILEAEGIIAPPPPPPPSPPRGLRGSTTGKASHQSIKKDVSNNHDYLSNSELHRDRHGSVDCKRPFSHAHRDEKKPNTRATEPKYILIESDSETESGEAQTKRKTNGAMAHRNSRASGGQDTKANQNGTAGGSGGREITNSRTVKSENGGQDENRRKPDDHSLSHQSTSDSKKRIRAPANINDPSGKRKSSISTNSNVLQNGGGRRRSSQNETNAGTQLRESKTNDVYLEDSSDDDDKFQDQIIGSARANGPKDDPKHAKNLASSKKTKREEDEGERNRKVHNTANAIDHSSAKSTAATTANRHPRNPVENDSENKINPGDFVDLTELDSD